MFFVYKITQKYFDEKTAKLSVVIYILYLNTLGLVLLNYTELFFTSLIISSIYFYSRKTKTALLMSGLLLGASIAVRPTGWALLICFGLISAFNLLKHKKFDYKLAAIISGAVLFILLFGGFNYLHFGKFIFSASTGPVNLLLGANETATGGFNSRVFDKGNTGFIENPDTMTYTQKGDYYFSQATDWIQQNPVKWITLMPMKLIHTFAYDDIAISSLAGAGNWNLFMSVKNLIKGDYKNTLPSENFLSNAVYIALQVFYQIYYYLLLIILFLWLVDFIKQKTFKEHNLIHILFFIVGILMIVVTVGAPRYKYPFIIVMMPFVASFIKEKYLEKIELKN
jgi:hypothetical protein